MNSRVEDGATAPTVGAASLAELLHELDTPLGMALMAASLQAERLHQLECQLVERGDHRSLALLSHLDEGNQLLGDSLERAIRVLRQHTRQAGGRAAGPPPAQPLASVLEMALCLPLARFSEQAITCSLDVEPGLTAPGSASVWSQVLSSLVSNSALHGFAGREGGRISITARRSGPQVLRITYQDDGAGLSPAAREQAFRRRFTTRAAQGSSGLGLCILRDIVQAQLNGAIALLETPVGAAFAIDVPAAAAA